MAASPHSLSPHRVEPAHLRDRERMDTMESVALSRRDLPACSMAFQPIVDVLEGRTVAYEALVRGPRNEPAASVLNQPIVIDRPFADQNFRLTAIEVAASLGLVEMGSDLCVNLNPNLGSAQELDLAETVAAAERAGLPLERLILEITETERLRSPEALVAAMRDFRGRGLRTAIDDFGAGYAGLTMLSSFQPDILKVDIALTRQIHQRKVGRAIVRSVVQLCREIDIQLIAEGIEQEQEAQVLRDLGIRYMQGNYFGEPGFESLPVWTGCIAKGPVGEDAEPASS